MENVNSQMSGLTLENNKFEIQRDFQCVKELLPADRKLKLSSHDFCPTWSSEDISKLQEDSVGLS